MAPLIRHSLPFQRVIAVAVALAATPAAAELYKCVDSNGKTIYTSEASRCPGAKPHALTGEVQEANTSHPAMRAAARHRASGGGPASDAEDGIRAMWRRKRSDAEQELQRIDGPLKQLTSMVEGCQRGALWWTTDEAGLRKQLKCTELRERLAVRSARQQELREYLAGGLAEECRRSGCLPGWVR